MSCSAVGCTNRPSVESSLQFFRFPLGDQDKDRLRQWVVNVRRQDWTPTKSSRLCGLHFEDHAYNIDIHGKRRLKSTAVPTVFFPPEHLNKPARQRLVAKERPYQVMEEFSRPGSLIENEKVVNSYTTCQADPQQIVSNQDVSAILSAGASLRGGETVCQDASQTSMQSTVPRDSNVPVTTLEDMSEIAREIGSADVTLPDEKTASAQITWAGIDPGIPVATQTKMDAPCSRTRTLLDVPSPMETQEDAQDEMEVNTIKVEDDHLERTSAGREVEGQIKENEEREEDMKGMPVISSVIEGSVDSLSFCSLDMGVDMIEEMDKKTVGKPDQEEKKNEESDKRMIRDDSNKSVTSIVNTGHDCSGSQENGLKLLPAKQNEKVKVKDEPVDEEYDQALASNSTSGQVKDEPDTAEDNLKISSVFSVGGASLPTVTTAGPAMVPTPPKTTLIKRPSAPPLLPHSVHVACSACKKILTKGQTAYQRKGSSELFCSTACLTNPTKRTCHYCFRELPSSKETIIAPVDTVGSMKDFCSTTCLSTFNHKRNSAVVTPSSSSSSSSSTSTISTTTSTPVTKCSFCKICCISKHEVILQGVVYKLCGDGCFKNFRITKQLSMNSCLNCGAYCHDKSPQMKVDNVNKSFCKAACQAAFKQKTKTPTPCTMCHTYRPLSDMAESTDLEGQTALFCNNSCMTAHMVKKVSASGEPVECDCCRKTVVPAFHLAMSDTSIRNFCTLTCVVTFQEQFNKTNTQNSINVAQKLTPLPAPPSQPQTSQTVPASPRGGVKLTCSQCDRLFATKPELLQLKDKMVFLCGSVCSEEYKKINFVMDHCVQCKMEKVIKEVQRINSMDCAFCSEGCKLLYKHDLNKRWGPHCPVCSYCSSTSQWLHTGQFGGKNEDFCSKSCRSKFTMLYCQVAKCDVCGRQGKLIETLPMLGEVKHFCDLQCVLQFCIQKSLNQGQSQTKVPVTVKSTVGTAVANCSTPVIANVVSYASTPSRQPTTLANTALQGAVPCSLMKFVEHASTQTNTKRAPPPPPSKILKNKALLCKPMVQNKGVTCKPQMINSESQTDEKFPKVIVLPVPVPVFVPVPMNLYTQYTPQPLGLPIPVPVPILLPVTLNSAERIVQTIREIKEKIPSNPFEADILLMAEMVAEDGTETSRTPEQVQDDQVTDLNEDLDLDITSFLNKWEAEPASSSVLSNRPIAKVNLPPILDIPLDHPDPPPQSPVLDIESDFPIETLELMGNWNQQAGQTHSPPLITSPSRQRPLRKVQQKKKGQRLRAAKSKEAVATLASPSRGQEEAVAASPPKLQHKYGVDAWRRWVQWRNSRPDVEPLPLFGSRPVVLKEDVLRCTTAELGFGLYRFVCEVQRPNGQPYSPDSMFYLCLGLQQYLLENGRMENIFTDLLYSKFTTEITKLLKEFKPAITDSGYVHSRVEEEYLWECKQLGAYSPIVLLNTLLFFCTKHFSFRTLAQHHQLSFGHVMRCTRSNFDGTKTNFLRFYPPITFKEQPAEVEGVAAKRRREEQEKEKVLEMMENNENPLRCPVRLYEFYLSKCSESVKQRTNVFYLHPERSCIPNSPLWFSSMPLNNATIETMLTRILTIREIHLMAEGSGKGSEEVRRTGKGLGRVRRTSKGSGDWSKSAEKSGEVSGEVSGGVRRTGEESGEVRGAGEVTGEVTKTGDMDYSPPVYEGEDSEDCSD